MNVHRSSALEEPRIGGAARIQKTSMMRSISLREALLTGDEV